MSRSIGKHMQTWPREKKKNKGKYMQTRPRKKLKNRGKHMEESNFELRFKIISHMIMILLIGVVLGTSAYIIIKNSIKNEFDIGKVKSEIIETFNEENKTKNDVYIKNIGNVPSYLRTAIIISWKDKDGKILETKPEENIDYSINFSNSANWIKSSEGYYYYKNILQENTTTDILIEECVQIKNYDDRILDVSIATQAIQAEPADAVMEAWNVDIIDGVLVLKE